MKQIKNVTLAVLGGLLILSVATVSCSKKSSSPAAATATSFTPASAAVGATITISGTGFSGTATVTIGGVAATNVTVVNSTTITAVIPTGATSGAVVVTDGGSPLTVPGGSLTVTGSVPSGPTSDSVETAHLLAKWTFDANSQEAISQQAAATTVGTVTYTSAGQIGNCATFTAGALVYNPIAQLSVDTALESYSISAWIKIPTETGTEGLRSIWTLIANRYADIWGPVDLELNNGGVSGDTIALRADQVQVDGSGPHQATTSSNYKGNGGWTFVTETYDGTGLNQTLKLYANGTMIDSTQFTTVTKPSGTQTTFRIVPTGNTTVTTPTPANDVTIGTFGFYDFSQFQGGDGYGNYAPLASARTWAQNGITGQIDDIRVFNTAITQADITALFNYGSAGK